MAKDKNKEKEKKKAVNQNKEIDKAKEKDKKEIQDIIKKNIFTYFNAIFLLIAILLIITGSYRSLTFLPVIIANIIIGIVQQIRAKKTLDKLTLLHSAKYHILRSGKEMQVMSDELKREDIIFLEGGHQIPADAQVIEGQIAVSEAILTGESDEIDKGSGTKLMSGSFVVSGKCRARLTAVGDDSYIEKLNKQAKAIKEHKSEMVADIDRIVKFAGIAIIPIGGFLLYQGMQVNHLSFQESVESMVGAVIGMIPEGLYLLVTIALALSAMRLAQKSVLLHDMRSTESLARVDVLCVDKTGTITSNKMSVEKVIAPKEAGKNQITDYEKQLADYIATSTDNNITAQALKNYFHKGEILDFVDQTGFSSKLKYSELQLENVVYRLGAPDVILPEDIYRASEELLKEELENGRRIIVFAQKEVKKEEPIEIEVEPLKLPEPAAESEKAAPEVLGEASEPETETEKVLAETVDEDVAKVVENKPEQISEDQPTDVIEDEIIKTSENDLIESLENELTNMSEIQPAEGLDKESEEALEKIEETPDVIDIVEVPEEAERFQPLLFISLSNDLRPNVEETFQFLAEQEVRVVVISGDNPRTVSEIASSVSIPNAENYVDASTLKTREDISDAVDQYTVFGRVKPEQKKMIVSALRKKGQKVAMTGDGVNDILAMKEADCSIAMGAGSDAAMQAAQVVLLDSDFSHMEEIIAEGRRDINNITRSATLFLYKNMFSMFLAIFSIVNAFSYPLQPSQVSLVSMFNIGVPAFALSLERNNAKQHGRFLKVTLLKALPASLTSFISIAMLVILGQLFNISDTDVGVASTLLLSMVGFMILIRISSPMNAYRRGVIIACIIGFAYTAIQFHSLFAISSISYPCVLLAVVFAFMQESLMRWLSAFFDWFNRGPKEKEEDDVLEA